MSQWDDDRVYEDDMEERNPWPDEGMEENLMHSTSPSNRRKPRSRKDTTYWLEDYGFDLHFAPLCEHKPRCVLKSDEGGWSIWAGTGADCRGQMGNFDLLLNLTGDSVLAGHCIPVPELAHWQGPRLVPEIVLDWPDLGIVHLPREFWTDLVRYLALKRARILVFCVGGHGRTGTAIACIMATCGWESADAIAWVRANYCPRAIETRQQEEYVRRIARENPDSGPDNLPF
jgi:hypothetical protein